jgi:Leucine-rich repeat (LRR) protein
MFVVAGVFLSILCGALIEMPAVVREQSFEALRSLHVGVVETDGKLIATFERNANDTTLTSALPYLALLDVNGLNLIGWQATTLPSLDHLTALQTLNLSYSQATTWPSLDHLTAVQTLDLSGSQATTLPSLDHVTALQTLNLSYSQANTWPSLDHLTALQTLDLSGSQATTLPSLDHLIALRFVILGQADVSLQNSPELMTRGIQILYNRSGH